MKTFYTYFIVSATDGETMIVEKTIKIGMYGDPHKMLMKKLYEIFEYGCEYTIHKTGVSFED